MATKKKKSEVRSVEIPELHWRLWRANATMAGVKVGEYIVSMMQKALKVRP